MSCTVVLSCDDFNFCIKYGNGSFIQCSDRQSLQCSASLTADPDIAGSGVLAAFVATALFTVAVAWGQLLLGHRHFGKRRKDSNLYKANENLLGGLCDRQIITGSAIILAGFAQISTISFYHESLIVDYWYLTLNSFWAARSTFGITYGKQLPSSDTQASKSAASTSPGRVEQAVEHDEAKNEEKESTQPEQDGKSKKLSWRDKVRIGCIVCSLILFTVFQIHVVLRELHNWDLLKPDYCYRYHDYSPRSSIWLWIAGVIILTVAFSLMLTPRTKTLINWDHYTKKARTDMCNWCEKAFWNILAKCIADDNVSLAAKLPAIAFKMVCLLSASAVLLTYSCILQFLGIFSYGDGYWPLEMAFLTALTAWQTFDIFDLKLSNKILLEDSETRWGFGQVLPIALLAMICFNVMNAWEDQSDD
ncbi:MAG: hypothetical protein M1820_007029 [Bogoriella megaspora]|nr:MAG: hypothetical protein M1820_007029 [Bogoriella megaspora]